MLPFYNAPVKFVTVLHLTKDFNNLLEASQSSLAIEDQKDDEDSDQVLDFDGKENLTPSKAKKKVVFSSPPDDRKKSRPLISQNRFDLLASPSPDPEPQAEKYYIQSQNDLYQTSEWIKFLVPYGVGVSLIIAWQLWATFLCVVGVKMYDLMTQTPRKLYAANLELFDNNDKKASGAH